MFKAKRVWFLVFVMLILGGVGMKHISFNVDLLDMLPDIPEVKGLKTFQKHFLSKEQIIIAVETPVAETSRAAVESLAQWLEGKKEISSEVRWRPWWEESDKDAAELAAWMVGNADPVRVEKFVNGLKPGASVERMAASMDNVANSFDLAEVERVSADPLGMLDVLDLANLQKQGESEGFSSPDGKLRMLFVRWAKAPDGYRELSKWIDSIKGEIAAWEQANPDLAKGAKYYYTNDPAFRAEISMIMERDMTGTMWVTNLGIILLFWILFRRLTPLPAIVLMLACVMGLSLGVGALLFGELNVMSMGFAAVLLGLVVDYAVVIYQEARVEKGGTQKSLWQACGRSIIWASISTAAVFLTLNLSSMPGLGQLGTLVAVGVTLGAFIMLFVFAPIAVKLAAKAPFKHKYSNRAFSPWPGRIGLILGGIAISLLGATGIPHVDPGFDSVRMRNTRAYDDMIYIASRMDDGNGKNLPVIIIANTDEEMAERANALSKKTKELLAERHILAAIVPVDFWPQPQRWEKNLPLLGDLSGELARWEKEADAAGFTPEALALLRSSVAFWEKYASSGEVVAHPQSEFAKNVLRVLFHREGGELAMVANIKLPVDADLSWQERVDKKIELARSLETIEGVYVAEWQILSPALQKLVDHDIRAAYPIAGLVLLVIMFLAFRNVRDMLLAIGSLGLSFVFLLCFMKLFQLLGQLPAMANGQLGQGLAASGKWNLLNLTAIPLLLGTGIDYVIHVIMSLRRVEGHLDEFRMGVGRALTFCAGSTAIGFGSLAFASHPGLSSLGVICSFGIMIVFIVARFILPRWWFMMHPVTMKHGPLSQEDNGEVVGRE